MEECVHMTRMIPRPPKVNMYFMATEGA